MGTGRVADTRCMKKSCQATGDRSRGSAQRGQALVEFALVTPVLALLLFAIAEFGFLLNNQISVTNGARNGARLAAIDGSVVTSAALQIEVADAVSGASNRLIGCPLDTQAPPVENFNANPSGSPTQAASWTVTASCSFTGFSIFTSQINFLGFKYTVPKILGSVTMRDVGCDQPNCNP